MKKQSDWMQGLLYAESECKRLGNLSYGEVKCHLQWLIKDAKVSGDGDEFIYGIQDYLNHYIKLNGNN